MFQMVKWVSLMFISEVLCAFLASNSWDNGGRGTITQIGNETICSVEQGPRQGVRRKLVGTGDCRLFPFSKYI